jgi:aconitate hydratase
VDAFRNYYTAQKMFGIPRGGECHYSTVVELDLESVVPAIAGPKRPQDRIALENVKKFSLIPYNLKPQQDTENKQTKSA